MVDVKLPLPIFPRASVEYDQKMMNDLLRALDQFKTIIQHPGEGRHNKLTLTSLPTAPEGLEAGALYALDSDGIVRIVRSYIAPLTGFTITSGLGSVTVTIT